MTKKDVERFPRWSREYVIAHAKWKAQRGKKPSLPYFEEHNPQIALLLAKQLIFPKMNEVIIDSIGQHFRRKYAGYQILSFGRRSIIDGQLYEPICSAFVPLKEKYSIGQKLKSIPKNAIPIGAFVS